MTDGRKELLAVQCPACQVEIAVALERVVLTTVLAAGKFDRETYHRRYMREYMRRRRLEGRE